MTKTNQSLKNVPEATPDIVRRRIIHASKTPHRYGLMFGYLVAGRASEIVGKKCPSDKGTTPRGPTGKDVKVTKAKINDEEIDAAVFTVKTSKRDGLPRSIGVPLNREYEPWAAPLVEYFAKFDKNDHVFPYTRQDLFPSSVEVFSDDYAYFIEPYTVQEIDQDRFDALMRQVPEELHYLVRVPKHLRNDVKISRHKRKLRLHGALRHYRLIELTEKFGFNREDRKIYAGHTMDVTDRYTHLDWQSYFPKLLLKRY